MPLASMLLSVLVAAPAVHLSGHVIAADGTPADGVLVRLLGADLTTLTGPDGYWQFEEGTPRACFPRRLVSPNTIEWPGPGRPISLHLEAKACITVLMFDGQGRQLRHVHANLDLGAQTVDPGEVPAATAFVSVATQACDRVAYRIAGGAAVETFSTCANAAPAAEGPLDILSIEEPSCEPIRAPITSYSETPTGLAEARLQALDRPTFYIDPLAGDDAGPGSVERPWRSAQSSLAKLRGGELVLLRSGEYGTLELPGETGYDGWVTLAAAPGATPVFERIVGNNNSTLWDGEADAWLRFEGLTVENGIYLRGLRWVEASGCTLRSRGEINGSMENIQKCAFDFRNARGIRVEGCDVSHTGNGLNGVGNHIVYRRNHIHEVSQDGFHWLGGHDFLAEYNLVHDMEDGAADSEKAEKPWNMHCDNVQMYPWHGNDEPSNWLADVTMRGNVFYRPEGQGWMIQAKTPHQLKRFLIENNITAATPGYMFHFKDACDGVIVRFNSFLIPDAGFQWVGIFGRHFETAGRGPLNWVAVPGWGESTEVDVYGNIMGGGVDFDGPKLTRCDNNLYYSPDGNTKRKVPLGPGERVVRTQPFADPYALDGRLAADCPAARAGLVLDDQPTPRQQVAPPRYDAYGTVRDLARITLGAVEAR